MARSTKSPRRKTGTKPPAGRAAPRDAAPPRPTRTGRPVPTRGKRPRRAAGTPARRPRAARKGPGVVVLVGTRKGAFVLRGDGSRRSFRLSGPHYLGSIVNHVILDPRDGRTLLMAARTGHLGPTIFRSTDWGLTWQEASQPPAFPKAGEGANGRSVNFTFWLTPGHASQPGVWFAGTSPHGLFRSADGGASWSPVQSFNDQLARDGWTIGESQSGELTHSVLVDPRDGRHMYVALSTGGIFETTDGQWRPLNKGVAADFMPEPNPATGHDPHCLRLHPLAPDRLYHQNHCGIYRLDRPSDTWTRIGDNMPRAIGDIGFPMVLHPHDPDTLWVFPMDGTSVWPRTSPGGKPSVYRSRNGGRRWERQDAGLPRRDAYYTVKRQAMCADVLDPVGLYFGTTSGDVWASRDEGRRWERIASALPEIYSVEAALR